MENYSFYNSKTIDANPSVPITYLNTASSLMVWAIQYWAKCRIEGIDPIPKISSGFKVAKLCQFKLNLALILNEVLEDLIQLTEDKSYMRFGTPRAIGEIETMIIIILALEYNNECLLAKRILRSWLPKDCSGQVQTKLKIISQFFKNVNLRFKLPDFYIEIIASTLTNKQYGILCRDKLN